MKRIRINDEQAEFRYGNIVKVIIDLIKPKNLILVAGRGTAKSTDILAERTIDICYDMPRAPFAFVANTFVNLLTNIIPAITTAWRERKKWIEYDSKLKTGHFVMGEAPPSFWPKPYTDTYNYKHTITTFLGNKFFLVSLDRADISAGISVVHHFIDEAKYAEQKKVNKLFPTLRGDAKYFGHSPYFMGQTFTTDMPNPHQGEFDWILSLEKKMDKEQIQNILQVAFVINDLRIELVNARSNGDNEKEERILKNLERWLARYNKVRINSTFFYVVSSFVNADVLTVDYFRNLYETMEWEEFKVAVLSRKASLAVESRFYSSLGDKHFYTNGYNYDYYDQFGLKDNISQNSAGLRFIIPTQHLDAGFDAGNMMSLVIGQEQGQVNRILKNFYVLPPDWIRELADQFLQFFRPHDTKILQLWCDRSANNYRRQGQDFASKLKNAIEHFADGSRTGWSVQIMTIGQRNITHSEEYDLVNDMLAQRNKNLPRLEIDAYECKELASSLRMAPLGKDSKGNIIKIKRSEKLPAHRLPMESTNMSDAFKYYICRKKYLALVRNKKIVIPGDVKVR